MSDSYYLKCPCRSCGAPIEFPANGVGSTVACPHCRERTVLFDPSQAASDDDGGFPAQPDFVASDPEEAPAESRFLPQGSRIGVIAVVVALLLVAGGGVAFWAFRGKTDATTSVDSMTTAAKGTPSVTGIHGQPSVGTPGTMSAGKSPGDLKVGAVTLEKAKGSSLIYAVGVLKNDSDHQRFGVNIELELADAKGNKAGVAKDYRQVIEPRQEWRFRALVLDSKAVSARVSSIREEE